MDDYRQGYVARAATRIPSWDFKRGFRRRQLEEASDAPPLKLSNGGRLLG